MSPLFSLPSLLPTLYMLQMISLCGPLPSPAVRDTFLSDRE